MKCGTIGSATQSLDNCSDTAKSTEKEKASTLNISTRASDREGEERTQVRAKAATSLRMK